MSTVFVVRHGPTRQNRERIIQGQGDGEILVEETKKYLQKFTLFLQGHNPTSLVSSDLGRAVKTAQLLRAELNISGLTVETEPLLRERSFAECEGKLIADMGVTTNDELLTADWHALCGGESDAELEDRVMAALRRIVSTYNHQTVIAVTHGGWIGALLNLADQHSDLKKHAMFRTGIYEIGLELNGSIHRFAVHRIRN